jgi:hypothetical protein
MATLADLVALMRAESARLGSEPSESRAEFVRCVDLIARAYQLSNPKFDRARFRRECGVDPERNER